jgi:hypothetical protein
MLLMSHIRNNSLIQGHGNLYMFPSMRFIVLALIFRSMFNFELLYVNIQLSQFIWKNILSNLNCISFLMSALTKCYKLGGLKPHPFIIIMFQKWEVWNRGVAALLEIFRDSLLAFYGFWSLQTILSIPCRSITPVSHLCCHISVLSLCVALPFLSGSQSYLTKSSPNTSMTLS